MSEDLPRNHDEQRRSWQFADYMSRYEKRATFCQSPMFYR